jgi:hypothetical protein
VPTPVTPAPTIEAPKPVAGDDDAPVDDDFDTDEEAPAPLGSIGKGSDEGGGVSGGILDGINNFVQDFSYTFNPFRFFADLNADAVVLVPDDSCRIKGAQLKDLGLTSKKEGENKVYSFNGEKIYVKDKDGKIIERVAAVEKKYEAAYKSFCGAKSCGEGGKCQQGSDGLCNMCAEVEEEAPAPSGAVSPSGEVKPPAGANQPPVASGPTTDPKPATPAKCPSATEGATACKAGTCDGGTCQFTPERCTKAFNGDASCLPASCGCVPSAGGTPSAPTTGSAPTPTKPPTPAPAQPELPVPVTKVSLDGCQLTSGAAGFEFPKSGPNAGMVVFKDANGKSNVVMSMTAFKALSPAAQAKKMEDTKTSTGKSIADEANERGKAVCENGTNTCKNSATKCKFDPNKERLLDRCYCPTATPPTTSAPSTPAGGVSKPPTTPPTPPVTPVPTGLETEVSCGASAQSTAGRCSQSLCDSRDSTGTQLKCVRNASVTFRSAVTVTCSCRNPKCYFFTTNWCGNCPDGKARLAALNKKCIVIDGDSDPGKLGERFGVTSYPTVVDVDEQGNKVDSYDPRTR